VANLYWPKRSQFRSDKARRKRFEGKINTAVADAKKALVISHGGCLDGVGSAIMALRAWGADQVGVTYTQPSNIQDVLQYLTKFPGNGRTVHITDLSLNAKHFDNIVASVKTLKDTGWSVEWRDHHEKQWENIDLERLNRNLDALEVNHDHTESGASLAQKAFCPKDKYAKQLANTIRDRDLWWNKTPDSETLEFAINEMGTDNFTAHCLARGANDKVVDENIAAAAQAHRVEVEHDAKELLGQTRYFDASTGEKVGVIYGWLPKNVGLHRVLEVDNVQVAVNVRPNGHMSLRSRKGADVCQLVASKFDGGGHVNASGGTLGLKGASFWTYVVRRGRVAKVDSVAMAAVAELETRKAA
jgi:oligoribonuclease NrnB/cAMP/cGMP phosphodiesterase (DHH superfamily)